MGFAEVEDVALGLSEVAPVDVEFNFCANELEPLWLPDPGLGACPLRYGSLPAVFRLAIDPGKSFDFVVGKGEARLRNGLVSRGFAILLCELCLATSAVLASL